MVDIDEAKRLYDSGLDAYRAGEYEEAIESLTRARSLYAEAGDRKGESEALNDLGVVCIQMDEWEDAHQHLNEALTIRRELTDRSGEGITLGNLGMLYARQGDDDKAEEAYEQAIEIFQELGEEGNRKAVDRQLKRLRRVGILEMLGDMVGLGRLTGSSEDDEDEGDYDVIDVTPEGAKDDSEP
jgi:tetratricopeptide (TPR) repeat protein